jgi:peptide deformylase
MVEGRASRRSYAMTCRAIFTLICPLDQGRKMAVREVLRMGDPRLLRVADRVTAFDTPALHALIQDLTDTVRALDGAGLAAPQIGVPLQVAIFEVQNNPRYHQAEPIPFTVLINPELTPLSEEMEEGWEGCLSVPGLRGKVPRYTRLRYRGFDAYGRPIERTVAGFHARVVQHETDHLHGILYPMRMRDHGSRAGLALQG